MPHDPNPTLLVACPDLRPHEPHNYVPMGVDQSAHCDGVKEPDRRAAWDHPAHYGGKDNPYEAIKVIEAWDLGFNLGNTVKYISRAGKKVTHDDALTARVQDLEKARWYLDREISNLIGGQPG